MPVLTYTYTYRSGDVSNGGKYGTAWKYVQILVVIQSEVEDYKRYGPRDAAIFELPSEAEVCR